MDIHMSFFKRTAALLLTFVLLATAVWGYAPAVFAGEQILDAEKASGSDYTDRPALAAALDAVFAGDIDLFRNYNCTKEKEAPLGSSHLTGSNQYYIMCPATGDVISGWQCYIYGNAVYNKLFGEYVFHGGHDFLYSELVMEGGVKTVSYEAFKEAGILCGAYMRTTCYKNGTYHSSKAHSLIILSYDEETISYVDGNSDGRGLVRINTRTWEEFNRVTLSGKSRYVAHIVQPTREYYDSLYPLPEKELAMGDLNDNGKMDALDYMLLKLAVLGKCELSFAQKQAADVSGNGKVDPADYLLVKTQVLGRGPVTPR